MTLFADRLREARQRIRNPSGSRMTQGDLAKAVGVERNTVSRWENSGVRPKDPAVIARLAEVLHVTMEYLVGSGDDAGARPPSDAPPFDTSAGTYLERRVPPEAYEVIHGYQTRLIAAGATAAQRKEAETLLLNATFTALRRSAPRERPASIVLADIEAMWRYIVSILAQDGIDISSPPPKP
ncbi:MAG TPA: helix-turn-helix transcriptional regulator [Gemmatimonadaceae bacterium]|nr:helix-turn-helix transcriptional regulator [Gemmatimonadaceae bacterium]